MTTNDTLPPAAPRYFRLNDRLSTMVWRVGPEGTHKRDGKGPWSKSICDIDEFVLSDGSLVKDVIELQPDDARVQ